MYTCTYAHMHTRAHTHARTHTHTHTLLHHQTVAERHDLQHLQQSGFRGSHLGALLDEVHVILQESGQGDYIAVGEEDWGVRGVGTNGHKKP